MKLWGSVFSKETNSVVNDFNSSISFDCRMYREDIEGSIAHATMLAEQGIITGEDSAAIVAGLSKLLSDIEDGKVNFSVDAEDIHMNIETLLTERIGDAGKRLHTARSRNDQVAVDTRLYLKKQTKLLGGQVATLVETLLDIAGHHLHTVMPGYTHLQRAQPITFAHHMMAYVFMLLRDLDRLGDCLGRMDSCPLGCGALAGTTHPISRTRTAELLGFAGVCANSLDGVSDRDFVIELTSCIATLMMHLSRFSEEIILWCSWEFRFVVLDDAYSTGSSIMPQKKNPDVAELVRGKTGRVIGDLVTLLSMMKSLPLAYNKDTQEDKEAVFDALDTVSICLEAFTGMVATMQVQPQRMREAALGGFINATDCADYLTTKGVPFREAYGITGKLVKLCTEQGCNLETLPLAQYCELSPAFDEGIYTAVSLERCVEGRVSQGGPSPSSVQVQIATAKEQLIKLSAVLAS